MNYTEFKFFIKKSIEAAYSHANVSIQEMEKNNQVILDALIIKEEQYTYTPTIYLNDFYQDFCDGTSLIQIIFSIKEIYEQQKTALPFDVSFFHDFQKVKGKIVYKLINYDRNKNLLCKVPFIRYLDLAIVFNCLVSTDSFGNATILIKNDHLSLWNIRKDELYEYAKMNTPALSPYEFKEMFELFHELTNSDKLSCQNNLIEDSGLMYVLSNERKINGASCLLYDNILIEISKQLHSDFYILPSSIHELIIIPAKSNKRYQELSDMVLNVNESQLAEEEILSDHVYFYSRNTKAVSM